MARERGERKNLGRAKEVSKKFHDWSLNPVRLHMREQVFLRDVQRRSKLDSIYRGPFKMVQVHSPEAFWSKVVIFQ